MPLFTCSNVKSFGFLLFVATFEFLILRIISKQFNCFLEVNIITVDLEMFVIILFALCRQFVHQLKFIIEGYLQLIVIMDRNQWA